MTREAVCGGRIPGVCCQTCVCVCVCACAAVLGLQGQPINTTFTKWREEEGGEAATSSNPSRAPASINHRDCYTMVIPKTISMITRTNKISNCYHPSHLPPVKSEGRRMWWWWWWGPVVAGRAVHWPPSPF